MLIPNMIMICPNCLTYKFRDSTDVIIKPVSFKCGHMEGYFYFYFNTWFKINPKTLSAYGDTYLKAREIARKAFLGELDETSKNV